MEIKKKLGLLVLILLIPLVSSTDADELNIYFSTVNDILTFKYNSLETDASNNTFYIHNNLVAENISTGNILIDGTSNEISTGKAVIGDITIDGSSIVNSGGAMLIDSQSNILTLQSGSTPIVLNGDSIYINGVNGDVDITATSGTIDLNSDVEAGNILATNYKTTNFDIFEDGDNNLIFDDITASGTHRFLFKVNGAGSGVSAWGLWNPNDNFATGMLFADGETVRFNSGIHATVETNGGQDDSILVFRVMHNNGVTGTGRAGKFYIDGHLEEVVSQYDLRTTKEFNALGVYSNDISGSVGGFRPVQVNASGDFGFDSSSEKFKKNIKNLTSEDTSWIYDLPTKVYDRKDGSNINEIGMIAEEVNLIKPSIVSYKNNVTYKELCQEETLANGSIEIVCHSVIDKVTTTNEPESINYASGVVITSIIKEVQTLKQENQMLKDRLTVIENMLNISVQEQQSNLYRCSTNPTREETCVSISGTRCYYEEAGKSPWGVCTLGEWIKI